MTNCSAIRIKGPKGSFNVTQPFTCISKNIVYGIICKRYNIIYIGETGRRLADRITEHIRSIRNNFSGFPVAQHLNPPSHCSLNDFSVNGIIHCNCSNVNRLNIEKNVFFLTCKPYLPWDLTQNLTHLPLRKFYSPNCFSVV